MRHLARNALSVLLFLSGLPLLLFPTSCNDQKTSEHVRAVRFGYSRLRISLPVFVALEKGFFREEGLSISLQGYDTAQPMMDDLVTGKIDVAGYCAFPITFNAQLRTQTRLKFLTVLYEDSSHPISILIVPSGSKVTRLRDLKGKSIGILPTIAYKAWLVEAMRREGVSESEFTIINVDPTFSPAALRSGQIDALFSNDPALTATIRTTGAFNPFGESLTTKYLQNPFMFGSFNAREDFVANSRDAAKGIARALDKAIDFIRSNPEEAKKTMIPYIPSVFAADVARYPDPAYKKVADLSEQDLLEIAGQCVKWGITKGSPSLSGSAYK